MSSGARLHFHIEAVVKEVLEHVGQFLSLLNLRLTIGCYQVQCSEGVLIEVWWLPWGLRKQHLLTITSQCMVIKGLRKTNY